MCDIVVRLNSPRNWIPLSPDSNLGMIGKQLISPEFKNSPSVEEFCRVAEDYAEGRCDYDALRRMYERIPKVI